MNTDDARTAILSAIDAYDEGRITKLEMSKTVTDTLYTLEADEPENLRNLNSHPCIEFEPDFDLDGLDDPPSEEEDVL